MNKKSIATISRWLARLSGLVFILFVLMMLGVFGGDEPANEFNSNSEITIFAFFPIGYMIGLILGWKWELLGGLIVVGCIGVLFAWSPGSTMSGPWFWVMAVPGFLFLLAWYLTRSKELGA